MFFLEFRNCFELYADSFLIKNEAQLRYIMRSLGYFPTVAESKKYMKDYGIK